MPILLYPVTIAGIQQKFSALANFTAQCLVYGLYLFHYYTISSKIIKMLYIFFYGTSGKCKKISSKHKCQSEKTSKF